jgi:endonuclease III
MVGCRLAMARSRNSTPAREPRQGSSKPKPSQPLKKATHATVEHVSTLSQLLAERWPDVRVELDHQNAYQLLVATVLAAQNTDKNINTITPAVFAKYPDPRALAAADQGELEQLIFRSGFYRNKAASLIAMMKVIVDKHGGEIPNTIEALSALPGVGRKTANVVLGNTMNIASGIVVDTHISRVAPRLGLTVQHDPVKIENEAARSGEDRERADDAGPAGSMDRVGQPHDPSRSLYLPREEPVVRSVPTRTRVSECVRRRDARETETGPTKTRG